MGAGWYVCCFDSFRFLRLSKNMLELSQVVEGIDGRRRRTVVVSRST